MTEFFGSYQQALTKEAKDADDARKAEREKPDPGMEAASGGGGFGEKPCDLDFKVDGVRSGALLLGWKVDGVPYSLGSSACIIDGEELFRCGAAALAGDLRLCYGSVALLQTYPAGTGEWLYLHVGSGGGPVTPYKVALADLNVSANSPEVELNNLKPWFLVPFLNWQYQNRKEQNFGQGPGRGNRRGRRVSAEPTPVPEKAVKLTLRRRGGMIAQLLNQKPLVVRVYGKDMRAPVCVEWLGNVSAQDVLARSIEIEEALRDARSQVTAYRSPDGRFLLLGEDFGKTALPVEGEDATDGRILPWPGGGESTAGIYRWVSSHGRLVGDALTQCLELLAGEEDLSGVELRLVPSDQPRWNGPAYVHETRSNTVCDGLEVGNE